ncbi:MAG: hypothetical protein PHW96_00205 [Candidatus Nanoarchaeia archaeon]|nr:hypothetical protein [Candidatus Nanoarchaeia archaeon]
MVAWKHKIYKNTLCKEFCFLSYLTGVYFPEKPCEISEFRTFELSDMEISVLYDRYDMGENYFSCTAVIKCSDKKVHEIQGKFNFFEKEVIRKHFANIPSIIEMFKKTKDIVD